MSRKVNANSLRIGNVIQRNRTLYKIVDREHTKPGKGGAFIQVELKSLNTNSNKIYERFRSTENIEIITLEQVETKYLFHDRNYVTLQKDEYGDTEELPIDWIKDNKDFLVPEVKLTIDYHDGQPVRISFPDTVELQVQKAEPVIKGQTVNATNKTAILDNEIKVKVPNFINEGDFILVRVEDRKYLERTQKAQ